MSFTAAQVMPLFLEACPSFRPLWRQMVDRGQGVEPDLRTALGRLASHLVGLMARGTTDELPSVFRHVELLLAEGEQPVREALRLLVAGIQNRAFNRGHHPDAFKPLLGERTRQLWTELEQIWDGE